MTARRHAALMIIIIPRNILADIFTLRVLKRGPRLVHSRGAPARARLTRFSQSVVITSVSFRASGIDRARVRDCPKRWNYPLAPADATECPEVGVCLGTSQKLRGTDGAVTKRVRDAM